MPENYVKLILVYLKQIEYSIDWLKAKGSQYLSKTGSLERP